MDRGRLSFYVFSERFLDAGELLSSKTAPGVVLLPVPVGVDRLRSLSEKLNLMSLCFINLLKIIILRNYF